MEGSLCDYPLSVRFSLRIKLQDTETALAGIRTKDDIAGENEGNRFAYTFCLALVLDNLVLEFRNEILSALGATCISFWKGDK